MSMLTPTPQFAAGTTYITNSVLTNLINFLAPVLGIALVVFCCVQGWKLFKGSETGSFKKLLGGVGTILLLLGIMYAAGSFETYGKFFKEITNNVIEKGSSNAKDITGDASIVNENGQYYFEVHNSNDDVNDRL